MKTNICTRILALALIFITSQRIFAHRVNQEAELLWSRKGIIIQLFQAREARQLSEQAFNRFIQKKASRIQEDKSYYFHNSYNRIDSLEQWLNEANAYYMRSLDSFMSDAVNLVDQSDNIAEAASIAATICDNIDFESGTSVSAFNSNWTLKSGFACPGLGCNSFSAVTVSTLTLNDLAGRYSVTGSGYDANIPGNVLPVRKPGGTYSFRLENYANGGDAMQLSRTVYVDPAAPMYKYSFAAVLEDPGSSHQDIHKPYFYVRFKDPGGQVISCAEYKVVANPASAEIKENFIYDNSSGMDLYYRYWTDVIIPLNNYAGQNVTVEFVVSDCAWGGHLAYVYLDGECLSNTITTGSCISLADPTRILTAPADFNRYSWTGPGIVGSNSGRTVKVGKAGTYTARLISRGGCYGDIPVTVAACSTSVTPCTLGVSSLVAGSCSSNNNTYTLNGNVTLSAGYLNSGVIVVTAAGITSYYYAPFTSPFPFSIPNIYTYGGTANYTVKYYPTGFTGVESCLAQGTYTSPTPCVTGTTMNCTNCIGSFRPEIGKTYIVSAWVKDNGATATTSTYTNPYVSVSFNSGATTLPAIYAGGKIIDGWQRIYYEFTIPVGTTEISIALKTSSGTADFDDIRVHPIDAGFTSYVYDPVSLKLVAVLDDNNYATFYEYDAEGTLIRTKKETERGVVTITESRENNPKR